jgi:hypothetical protein
MCFYVFMRTTVDFPADLFRKAKTRAAARGESLKTLLTRAVAAEVGQDGDRTTPRRITLPLFGDPKGPFVDLRASDLARALADEDAAQVRGRRRRR